MYVEKLTCPNMTNQYVPMVALVGVATQVIMVTERAVTKVVKNQL